MKKPSLLIVGIDGAVPSYIKEQVSKGRLPTFASLMRQGVFFEDLMPSFPSITPTCWSSISCGAVPRVTGALCHQVHLDATHPVSYVTPYNSQNIKAERFWEAAARLGVRTLLMDVPCSGPAKCDGVFQVMGGTTYTPDCCPSQSYKSGVPQQLFSNDTGERVVGVCKTRAGFFEELTSTASGADIVGKAYVFSPKYIDKRYDPEEVEAHEWWILPEGDGVRIGVELSDASARQVLQVGDWSEVITRRLRTRERDDVPFHFRARLDAYDASSGSFTVFVSCAKNFYKEVTPIDFAREVAEIDECFAPDYAAIQGKGCNLDKFFESERFAFRHTERLILKCMQEYEPDIVFTYHERIDALNHRFRNAYEGTKISYDGEDSVAREAFERAYEQTDAHIRWLLENAADENTTVMVVSDHGSIGQSECFHPWEILKNAGLLASDNARPNWTSEIDWTRTLAYPVGSCYINVNLEGREPTGIVKKEDYDATVARIISALYENSHAKEGEKMALAFAVEKSQADFIGHGGENCGDVVYGLSGSHVGGFIGGVHSQQIPSAKTETGDIRALCVIKGPAFQKGICLRRSADLTDLAPTLCYALGYPQPKDATGGVIFGAFDNERR